MKTKPSFLHIDERLNPSRYQYLLLGLWLLGLCSLVVLTKLTTLTTLLLIGLILFCVAVAQFLSYQIHAISAVNQQVAHKYNQTASPKILLENMDWQLTLQKGVLFHRSTDDMDLSQIGDLWQAKLLNIHHIGYVMILTFVAFEPLTKKLVVQIWQDQCQADTWRQLVILAKLQQKD